jgi:subtilisin-like proprotein convertase family protein
VYTLKAYGTGGSADNLNTTYTVNASSEVANGVWNLRVQDNAAIDTGYINGWTLTFP